MITYQFRWPNFCYIVKNIRQISSAGLAMLSTASMLAGCGSILPKAPIQPTLYVLDGGSPTKVTVAISPAPTPATSTMTLTVTTPIASAGFGSTHIIYQRRSHELEHFALNQWVDTPAQMLAPLIVRALETRGIFRAVVRGSTAAASEFRLDTELVRIQQEFTGTPSRARVTLRAVLLDTATRRVIASREFDSTAPSPSEDPAGGVTAANEAVQRLLVDLEKFCTDAIPK
jgi:cholesterol transport system auxiliary component